MYYIVIKKIYERMVFWLNVLYAGMVNILSASALSIKFFSLAYLNGQLDIWESEF